MLEGSNPFLLYLYINKRLDGSYSLLSYVCVNACGLCIIN